MSTLSHTVLYSVENELQQNKYQEAELVLTHPDKLLEVEDLGMELIQSIGKFGIKDWEAVDNTPLETCERMLTYIANNFNPRLSFLALLEQADIFASSSKLSYFVVPVGCCLLRMIDTLQESKVVDSFAWALSTFNGFVKKNFETKVERETDMDMSGNISYLKCYHTLCDLYEYLNEGLGIQRQFKQLQEDRYREPSAEKIEGMKNRLKKCNAAVDTVHRYALEMLAEPLVLVNVRDPKQVGNICDKKEHVSSTVNRVMCLIQRVCVTRNTLKILDIDKLVEDKISFPSQDNMSPWDMIPGDEVPVSERAVAHFIYLVYIADFPEGYRWGDEALPPEIRLQKCLELADAIFDDSPESPNTPILCKKGMALVNKALKWLTDSNFKDSSTDVEKEFPNMLEFMKKLCILIMQCSDKDTRRESVDLLHKLTCQFNPKWRNKAIHWLLATSNHDSLKGYFVTIMKDSVCFALDEKDLKMREEFFGPKLESLLYKICILEPSDTSNPGQDHHLHNQDLLGRSNCVISVLNCLIYLYMRDGSKNETGFRDAMGRIKKDYLAPLAGLVEVSLQKYNLRKTMLYQGRVDDKENEPEAVASAIIDGVEVQPPNLSVPEKIESIQSSILTIEFIRERLVLLEGLCQ